MQYQLYIELCSRETDGVGGSELGPWVSVMLQYDIVEAEGALSICDTRNGKFLVS